MRALIFGWGVWCVTAAGAAAAPEVNVNELTDNVTYLIESDTVGDAKQQLISGPKPIRQDFTAATEYEVMSAGYTTGPARAPSGGFVLVPLKTVSVDIRFEITMPEFTNSVVADCFAEWRNALYAHEDNHIQVTVEATTLYFLNHPDLKISASAWAAAGDEAARNALRNAAFQTAMHAAYKDMQQAHVTLDSITNHGDYASEYLPDDGCEAECYARFQGGGMTFDTPSATFLQSDTPDGVITNVSFGGSSDDDLVIGSLNWEGTAARPPAVPARDCETTLFTAVLAAADEGRSFATTYPLCPEVEPPWRIVPNPKAGIPGEYCPGVPGQSSLKASIDELGFVVGTMSGFGVRVDQNKPPCDDHTPYTFRFRAAPQASFEELFPEGLPLTPNLNDLLGAMDQDVNKPVCHLPNAQ